MPFSATLNQPELRIPKRKGRWEVDVSVAAPELCMENSTDARNRTRPLKFQLVIYPELQVAKPRIMFSLWKCTIEELKFSQSDPSVTIIDQASRARYKFLSALEGDKQQLQWFYNACRGISRVNNITPQAPPGAVMPNAVMVQILNVVAFCHLQGVVHRDLKPEEAVKWVTDQPCLATLWRKGSYSSCPSPLVVQICSEIYEESNMAST